MSPRTPPLAQLEAAVQTRARALGAHYTPHPLAQRIARATLAPLCAGLSPSQVLRLRVCDPAVGSGRFLLAALRVLSRAAGDSPRHRRLIASRCLFGLDVDPRAVALARRALAHAAGCTPDQLAANIVHGDSLLADPASLLGVQAFDAVLANPPWISYSGRHASAIAPGRRRLLAARFAAFRGWPTTHGAFLELAAGLLRPGGRAALLVPRQTCHLQGYEAARRAALQRCSFEPPPEYLGENCFPGVVQPAAIIHLRRVPSAECCTAPAALPAGVPPRLARAIVGKMRRHPPAPPGTFRDPGVHTGNSARLVLHDEPGDGRVPVREGRCVHPFRLDPPRRWLDVAPRLPQGRYCRIRHPDAYLDARILLRQTANRPIAARHSTPTHFRNSILACYGIPGIPHAALLGLLNSAPVAFYHQCCHADSRQRAFPQVKIAHLRAIPIPREMGQIAAFVPRIEALAAAGPETRPAELADALRQLDALACQAYGLARAEARFVQHYVRGEKGRNGRGRPAAHERPGHRA